MTATASDEELVAAYLDELGLGGLAGEPSVEQLTLLHRAQVERFSHDTLWVVRGRVPELDYLPMVRAVLGGEGGACAQHALSFLWLLRHLGYEAYLHPAKVQLGLDDRFRDWPGHSNLTVVLDGRRWYVDPGLGNGVLEPIPLAEGTYEQGGFTYRIERSETLDGHWEFVHDRKVRAIRRTLFDETPFTDLASEVHDFQRIAHDPESPFRHEVSANRRHRGGVTSLAGNLLVHRDGSARTLHTLTSAQEWESVLREEFLLGLPDWSVEERDRIWGWIMRVA